MDTDNNGNSSDEAMGAQTAPAAVDSGQVHDAAERLQASVSQFLQENQRNHEKLNRSMDQPSDQVLKLERKIEDVRKATEKNMDRIRNYRQ